MTLTIEEIRDLMKDPHNRLSVALHEAGHVLYARRAGATELRYHGPLEHPDRPGEFGAAGVQPTFSLEGVHIDLPTMARWYCAGGVVKRVLCPHLSTDDEDATDYEIFCQETGALAKSPDGAAAKLEPQEILDFWKSAQQDVERDLRSPALRRELWDLAREIEKKIPWE